jgi:hypothetical protein
MVRTMIRSIRVLAIAGLCLCSACGIFSPRPVEYPTPTGVDDPFNFASILWSTGKKFTKLEYIDLFADGFSYIDVNGNTFTKDDMRNHLITIQRQLTIKSSTWKKDTANPDIFFSDTLIIVNRTYDVSAQDPLLPASEYAFADKASFRLLFNATKNAWTIAEWKDTYAGYSIFHPWFTLN